MRANDLGGREWTRNSISVWSDLRKDAEETGLAHPAVFPKALVRRCLDCFTTRQQRVVLDPFAGSGSTLLAAWMAGKCGIGFEINPDYVALAQRRQQTLAQMLPVEPGGEMRLFLEDARHLQQYVAPQSVDICITSPPYWNILTQKRSADDKPIRHYGYHKADLGRVKEYGAFLNELQRVFNAVLVVLKAGSYCLVNVMDLRKGAVFYPFHADLARALQDVGFLWDDVIIWDRHAEYNHLRPLGYPSVFRINKTHEYILILKKP